MPKPAPLTMTCSSEQLGTIVQQSSELRMLLIQKFHELIAKHDRTLQIELNNTLNQIDDALKRFLQEFRGHHHLLTLKNQTVAYMNEQLKTDDVTSYPEVSELLTAFTKDVLQLSALPLTNDALFFKRFRADGNSGADDDRMQNQPR